MRSVLTFALAIALMTSACASQRQSGGMIGTQTAFNTPRRSYRGLAYAHASPEQRLDLFLPLNTAEKPYPLIVYVHGGGYSRGTKEMMPPGLKRDALARGYAVASIDYRLLGQARFPAQIDDVLRSIEWLRSHASTYSLDPNRIVVWGFSAGGHLAMLAGTSGGSEPLRDQQGRTWAPAKVKAVVDWAGPSNFWELVDYMRRRGEMGPNQGGLAKLSEEVASNPQLLDWAEPLAHADPLDPPVLIEHGSKDRVIPLSQAKELARGLSETIGKRKVTLHVLPGVGHNLDSYARPQNLKVALDWVDRTLGR